MIFAILMLAQSLPLDSTKGLTAHNSVLEPVTFQGKKAIRMKLAPDVKPGAGEAGRVDVLALVAGMEFSNGTIEVDLAGEPSPGAGAGGARGFTGVAFRVAPDRKTYDCFYLRPTNGRADDQERRNHTVQYISHPAHTWFQLREATPSRYESWVDIGPAEWIHVKIDVMGDKARLFVNNATQPALIVNDVKTGANGKGGVALWIEGTTIAHFGNLKITPR
jgi:hypothetical protein